MGDHLSSRSFRVLARTALAMAFCTLAFGCPTPAVAQKVPSGAALQEDWLFVNCLRKQFPDIQRDISDHTRAFDPKSGRNFAYENGTWINVKTGQNICPKKPPSGAALQEDWLFVNCLRKRFPDIQRDISDHTRAFDPTSGRNFAYENGTWIDVKTGEAICPKAGPTIGMVIEPKISVGGGGSSSDPTYDSTGGQEPFKGDSSDTNGQVCGGATVYPGFVVGPAKIGLDVNVCSGSSDTLFRIERHGPGGDVDLHASTNVIIDVLFKGEVPLGPANNLFLSGGVGPTFRDLDLKLTSDQSFFGGGVPSESNSNWQTGVVLSAGLSTFVCPQCIGGYPLKLGVEGRARFFPSESVDLTSPSFGFTETGKTGDTTDYSVLTTFSTPFTMSDMRVKRDIVQLARLDNGIGLYRYRYLWSDETYVGVIAQEVARVKPEAVVRGADGYLRVDYRQLGMSLQTWDQWLNHSKE